MTGSLARAFALAVMAFATTASAAQEVAQVQVDVGDRLVWAGTDRVVSIEFALPVLLIEEQMISVFRRPLDLPVRLETRAWGELQELTFEPLLEAFPAGSSFVWDGQLARAQSELFERDGEPWRRFTVRARMRFASELEADAELQLPPARLVLTYATEWETDFLGERVPVNQREWVGEGAAPPLALRALPASPRAAQSSGVIGPVQLTVERSPRDLQRGEEFQVRVTVKGEALPDTVQVLAPQGDAWAWLGSIREDDGARGAQEQRYRFDGRLMEAGEWTLPPFELLRFDADQGAYVLEQSAPQTLSVADLADAPPMEDEATADPEQAGAPAAEPLPVWIPVLLGAGLLALAAWARQTMRQNVASREAQAFERITQAAAAREDSVEPLQLWLAARLAWPRARLSGPGTVRRLREAGIEAALAEQVAAFLAEAEAARYGGPPLADAAARRETLRRALDAATKT